jgi:hypothetical protein
MTVKMQKVLMVYSLKVEKLRCSARICCGRWGDMSHCKKYVAVLPPSPKSTQQDMPLQGNCIFSRFLTHAISRELVQKAREFIEDTLFRQIYDGLKFVVKAYMKSSQPILVQNLHVLTFTTTFSC